MRRKSTTGTEHEVKPPELAFNMAFGALGNTCGFAQHGFH
jgi:hypothetical protein